MSTSTSTSTSTSSLLPYIPLLTTLTISTFNLCTSHIFLPLLYTLSPSQSTSLWHGIYNRGFYTMVPTAVTGMIGSWTCAWLLRSSLSGSSSAGQGFLPQGWDQAATASFLAGLGCFGVLAYTRLFMWPTNMRLEEIARMTEKGGHQAMEKMDEDVKLREEVVTLLKTWTWMNATRGFWAFGMGVLGTVVLVKG